MAFRDNPALINLQLHQWKRQGEILKLKRGLYCFADAKPDIAEIARHLYWPCYFSLEYVLSLEGIIPEAVFGVTLVTTRAKRQWDTPFGRFWFRQIKRKAFRGFDPKTLLAVKEKALADYFYLNSARLVPREDFWEASRLEGHEINFKRVFSYARLFGSKKLEQLLRSFESYAKSH